MNKLVTLLAPISLILSANVYAGAANNMINCKSKTGDLELSGHIPGDFAEFSLTAKIKGANGTEEVKLYSEVNQGNGEMNENARISVVDALENGVLTIVSEDLHQENIGTIQLYALPSTVKKIKKGQARIFTFSANISVSSENVFAEKKVSCQTKYEI